MMVKMATVNPYNHLILFFKLRLALTLECSRQPLNHYRPNQCSLVCEILEYTYQKHNKDYNNIGVIDLL